MENNRVTNLASLNEICGGDRNFIIGIIDAYLEKANDEVAEIENACNTGNTELLKKKAHRCKSSVQFFEINEISDILTEIEKTGLLNNSEEEKKIILKKIKDITARARTELIEWKKQ